MTPAELRKDVIAPTLAMLPYRQRNAGAALLLAAAMQASGITRARSSEARGLWRMTAASVDAVLKNGVSAELAITVCEARGVKPQAAAIMQEFGRGDGLACEFAALLLLSERAPLPLLGDEEGAWSVYKRLWTPGKPDRKRWSQSYQDALQVITNS